MQQRQRQRRLTWRCSGCLLPPLGAVLLLVAGPLVASAARIKLDQRNALTKALLNGVTEAAGDEEPRDASGSETLSTSSLAAGLELELGRQGSADPRAEQQPPPSPPRPAAPSLQPQISARRSGRGKSSDGSEGAAGNAKAADVGDAMSSLHHDDAQEQVVANLMESRVDDEKGNTASSRSHSRMSLGEGFCDTARAASVCWQQFQAAEAAAEVSAEEVRRHLSAPPAALSQVWSLLALPPRCSCELLCRRAVQSLSMLPPSPDRGCELQGSDVDCSLDLSEEAVLAQLRPASATPTPPPSSPSPVAPAAATATGRGGIHASLLASGSEEAAATAVVNYSLDALVRRIVNMFGIFPPTEQAALPLSLADAGLADARREPPRDFQTHGKQARAEEAAESFGDGDATEFEGEVEPEEEEEDEEEETADKLGSRVLAAHETNREELTGHSQRQSSLLLQHEKALEKSGTEVDLAWGRRRRARRRRRTRRRRTRRRRTRRRRTPPATRAPTPPPCQDSSKYRDPTFKDGCKGWERFSCEGHPFSETLKKECPRSCRVCCKDSDTYRDPDFGEPCQYWRLRSCRSQRFALELVAACPVACNACGASTTVLAPSPAGPSAGSKLTSPAAARVRNMLPTARAAALLAVSKLNLQAARPVLEKWYGSLALTDANQKEKVRLSLNGVAKAMERVTFAEGRLCSESTLLYTYPRGKDSCGSKDLESGSVLCATSSKEENVVYICEPAAAAETSAVLEALLHELSRFPPMSTEDVDFEGLSTRGRQGAATLAAKNAALAARNGDNLAFFVQDVSRLA